MPPHWLWGRQQDWFRFEFTALRFDCLQTLQTSFIMPQCGNMPLLTLSLITEYHWLPPDLWPQVRQLECRDLLSTLPCRIYGLYGLQRSVTTRGC